MATVQTQMVPPPIRGGFLKGLDSLLSTWWVKWFQTVQFNLILKTGDTSGGGYAEALPPAAQNVGVTIVYKKISADGNNWQITGGAEGTQTLSAQYAKVRFTCDGAKWWIT